MTIFFLRKSLFKIYKLNIFCSNYTFCVEKEKYRIFLFFFAKTCRVNNLSWAFKMTKNKFWVISFIHVWLVYCQWIFQLIPSLIVFFFKYFIHIRNAFTNCLNLSNNESVLSCFEFYLWSLWKFYSWAYSEVKPEPLDDETEDFLPS